MSEHLHATTAAENCKQRKAEALQTLKHLRVVIDGLEDQLKSGDGNAVQMGWTDSVVKHALNVYNLLAMCNGAAMVRGIERTGA